MDIRSTKNNKENKSNGPRPGAVLRTQFKNFLVLLLIALILAGYTCSYQLKDSMANYHTYNGEDYISDEDFLNALRQNYVVNEELVRYAKNLNRFYIYHRYYKTTPDEERVTDEDIAQSIKLLTDDLLLQQQNSLTILNSVLLDEESTQVDINNAMYNFETSMFDINRVYRLEVESKREDAIKEINDNYAGIEDYLNTTGEFTYYIKDSVVNRTFTNLKSGTINNYLKNDVYFYVDLSEIEELFNGVPLNRSFSQNGIEGYIMVPYEQPLSSFVQDQIDNIIDYQAHVSTTARAQIIKYALALAVIIIAFILILRSLITNCKTYNIPVVDFTNYQKLPFFLKICSIIAAITYFSNLVRNPFRYFGYSTIEYVLMFTLYLVFSSFMGIMLLYGIVYIIKLLRNISAVKNEPELLYAKKALNDYLIMRKYSPYVLPCISFLIISGSAALAFISFVIIANRLYFNVFFIALPIVFILVICGAIISLKIIVNYSKLGYYIDNLAEGHMVNVPPEKGIFTSSINKLNDINSGLSKTLDEMLKSERTKTELITNVSHDLKTPLTSIINYIELLRGLNLAEPAKEYADVLAKKAQRLKILIEDLFEAAKLSSSSIELAYNKIDIVQLLEQTIGELSEKIEKSQLDFRFSSSKEHIYVLLDGQKMWRVFDNLLTNILKYSKKDTRVYISVTEKEKTIEISMKNISAYELDFDASELFERFKRGDQSRSTEGSGLGLSIAQNIVNLHGGKLDISIDGDLFKAEITLPKNIDSGSEEKN